MKDHLAGSLLIASSTVDAPVIARSVCLLVHDQDDAVVGVMLNRPMQTPPGMLSGLLGMSAEDPAPSDAAPFPRFKPADLPSAADPDDLDGPGDDDVLPESLQPTPTPLPAAARPHPVHFGGPLSGPVVAIHATSRLAEVDTGHGIYVAAQRDNLQQLISQETLPYRLIVGHLGWRSDQLADEIESGMWHVLPATAEAVFAGDTEMWPRLIRRATANSLAKWIRVPDNPQADRLN